MSFVRCIKRLIRLSRKPTLQFVALTSGAKLPAKAHTSTFEDAAWDLFYPSNLEPITLAPGERKLCETSLSGIIEDGYWVKFHDRSGLANKYGITVLGGVIDSGYTGEWKVILLNTGNTEAIISPGQAMCQFSLEEVHDALVLELGPSTFIEEKEKRTRGDNGFGSTDKK